MTPVPPSSPARQPSSRLRRSRRQTVASARVRPPRDQAVSYPEDLRQLVDVELERLAFPAPEPTVGLQEAMRYSLLAGGKRVRPVLALATARAVGAEPRHFLPIACAIELIHTYSLIHDDLPAMDDDELRRGQPTSHVKYGEDVAILAGDGLFAEAVRLACEQPGEPARVLAALRELSAATGVDGMVGGQYVDVAVEDRDAEGLRSLHTLKTGRLIAASVGVVLRLEGVPEPETMPFRRFANELGVLFQIVDDILDVTGSAERLGKPRGSDERHGKLTYVSLFGLERARELAAESHHKAVAALGEASGETGDLSRVADYIFTRDE
jgi:geranylgeranyl diphosphate synthase, type II